MPSVFACCLLPALLVLQNRTYERWWLARQAFSGMINGLINIARQVCKRTRAHQ
jgi:predicted membrane chloride channel (bestrophin family)